jgi:hypothetical protein
VTRGAERREVHRRLTGQLGTKRTLEDLRDLGEVLRARDTLAFLSERLLGMSAIFADAHLDAAKALLD